LTTLEFISRKFGVARESLHFNHKEDKGRIDKIFEPFVSAAVTGYLIGALGIRSAFVLAGAFLLIAGLVIAPLKLFPRRRKS
jgi:hypothetical protein